MVESRTEVESMRNSAIMESEEDDDDILGFLEKGIWEMEKIETF